jgi:transcriptional regulator with XRE-family HTH domain
LKLSVANTSKFKPLPDNEKEICWRLAAIRRWRGLNQAELAQRVGITRNQLANIEAKRVTLKFGVAMDICKAIEVSPQWLYDGSGPQKLNVEFKDPVTGMGLEIHALSETFSGIWAAFGKIFLDLTGWRERVIAGQGHEGQSAEKLSASYSGPPRVAIGDWHKGSASDAKANNKSKRGLDIEMRLPDKETVKPKIRTLSELLKILRALTKKRGAKADLARCCNVTRQAVNQWLSENSKPSADAMLLLLNWVEVQQHKNKNALAVR